MSCASSSDISCAVLRSSDCSRLSEEVESAVKATQSYRPTQPWDEPLVSFLFYHAPEGDQILDLSFCRLIPTIY